MCFSSRSGYRPFITPNPTRCPRKLTFRYNSMLNFIQVSFCFLLFLGLGLQVRVQGLGLGIGLGFGIGNLKNILKYLIGGAAGRVDGPVHQRSVLNLASASALASSIWPRLTSLATCIRRWPQVRSTSIRRPFDCCWTATRPSFDVESHAVEWQSNWVESKSN